MTFLLLSAIYSIKQGFATAFLRMMIIISKIKTNQHCLIGLLKPENTTLERLLIKHPSKKIVKPPAKNKNQPLQPQKPHPLSCPHKRGKEVRMQELKTPDNSKTANRLLNRLSVAIPVAIRRTQVPRTDDVPRTTTQHALTSQSLRSPRHFRL